MHKFQSSIQSRGAKLRMLASLYTNSIPSKIGSNTGKVHLRLKICSTILSSCKKSIRMMSCLQTLNLISSLQTQLTNITYWTVMVKQGSILILRMLWSFALIGAKENSLHLASQAMELPFLDPKQKLLILTSTRPFS